MQFQTTLVIAGVVNIAGTSSKNNRPYSLYKATVLDLKTPSGNVARAMGFQATEMSCTEQVMNQLDKAQFPVEVEAFMETNRNNEAEINSIRIPAAKAKAA